MTHVGTYWKHPSQHNEGGTQCCCCWQPTAAVAHMCDALCRRLTVKACWHKWRSQTLLWHHERHMNDGGWFVSDGSRCAAHGASVQGKRSTPSKTQSHAASLLGTDWSRFSFRQHGRWRGRRLITDKYTSKQCPQLLRGTPVRHFCQHFLHLNQFYGETKVSWLRSKVVFRLYFRDG